MLNVNVSFIVAVLSTIRFPFIVVLFSAVTLSWNVVSPETPNVPAIKVFPVVLATVNLFVATSKLPSTPRGPLAFMVVASRTPVNVVSPITFKLLKFAL